MPTMCNHYRNLPEKLSTWRTYIAWSLRPPNEEYATDVWPKRPGLIIRREGHITQTDVMAWGVPTSVRGASGKMLEKRVTNVRNLSSAFWRSMLMTPEQRCLVPFTAFAEPKIGQGRDEWWFTVIDQPLACFAGIWRQSERGPVYAFLTCEPNELVAPLHPKAMPVILDPADYDQWLDGSFEESCALAKPFSALLMECSG
jgi:putative SOS response-associated peptidase YedK